MLSSWRVEPGYRTDSMQPTYDLVRSGDPLRVSTTDLALAYNIRDLLNGQLLMGAVVRAKRMLDGADRSA